MRNKFQITQVTLFPFLSVLLCTMGVLAFLSISFLLVLPQDSKYKSGSKQKIFSWVGAPSYVKPIFIRCYKDRIEYYNFFKKKDYTLNLDEFLEQLNDQNPEIFLYFIKLFELNTKIKRNFGKTEYYPLLLVYPDGILASELVMVLIEKIVGLKFGLEPMLTNMEIPYQGLVH